MDDNNISLSESSGATWESSAEDFGQKVDLTVRIREILRNYPEGLSILKELIQNADDAGARTIRFCSAEPRTQSSPNDRKQSATRLSHLMQGPSLIAYNSAKFTSTDFKSIQQIGNSLKKDNSGTKTGRFGVGVNSTYHLTDVPIFVSGTKLVLFDPQAEFVPGVNPANPGKLIDCSKSNGRMLINSLPAVFDPLKVFGCKLNGKDFDGTTFRFALRTEEQAATSRLSRQSHSLEEMRELLRKMARAAPSMLLFLKNVECIEIYDWKAGESEPKIVHQTRVCDVGQKVREKRSFVLDASSRVPEKPIAVDYILDIKSEGVGTVGSNDTVYNDEGEVCDGPCSSTERWIICNQLGGGGASIMAKDPSLQHMKLVPWAGVAARLSPPCSVDSGNAYCFLPLPVRTKLPVHVNGYFELSSNRRDIWWGDDMAGDGRARAEWNRCLVANIAAPSYCRLVLGSIRTGNVTKETYETLFPQSPLSGAWEILGSQFLKGMKDMPVLYSEPLSTKSPWVAPSKSLLLTDESDEKLAEILSLDELPLVRFQNKELKEFLLLKETCKNKTTPNLLRKYFCNRGKKENGALEHAERKLEFAEYLLTRCISDLKPTDYNALSGCQFVPLASGNLGTFCSLTDIDADSLKQLQSMGFAKLTCMHSLRKKKGDIDAAMEWLLMHRYEDTCATVQHGLDPYLICSGDGAELLRTRASDTFIDMNKVNDVGLKKFLSSGAVSSQLNILTLRPDMLADVVERAIPRDWRGTEEAFWTPTSSGGDSYQPTVDWFINLWRFICSCNDVGQSLSAVAEQYCIVPTEQGVVCNLSPGASVLDASGLDKSVIEAVVSLGGRVLFPEVFPSDIIIPNQIWSYIFKSDRDGVIKSIEAAIRRMSNDKESSKFISPFDDASNDVRKHLYDFFAKNDREKISDESLVALRKFPIFRAYCNGDSTDTEFTSMIKTGTWYVLEGATDEDRSIMTSDFLCYEHQDELKLLTMLGAKIIDRGIFFRKVVIQQLPFLISETRNKVIERVLIDLSSLCSKDPSFESAITNAQFIPSAESGTLKAPSELYDPDVPQLRSLMGSDSFPDDFYSNPQLLLSLRTLGLQSTLTWDVVLECARSIERDGMDKNEEISDLAKARGKELLIFLDTNVLSFFPEFKKKSNRSTASKFLRKVNAKLFEDPGEKKRKAELQAERIQTLLSIKWIPVYTVPPHPFLPWPDISPPVASPLETATTDKMWLLSYSKCLVDGHVHSIELKKLFGWLDEASIKDVSLQLRMLGITFGELCLNIETNGNLVDNENLLDSNLKDTQRKTSTNKNILCQKVTSEVPRIYNILNAVESEYEIDVMKSVLYGNDVAWLWMGDGFVSTDHVAFSSPINAAPYLYTVPPDLACFKTLLSIFNVRDTFGSSDYCCVLRRMSQKKIEGKTMIWDPKEIELAVNLVQRISDDVLKLGDMEIYAPTENGQMKLTSEMVYDDAPWLSKDLPGKKEFIYAHPKLSASVSEKIGIKSVRKLLLQSNSNMINFGAGVVHEAFGQSESLTRRLKNILSLYPEGPQQLNELIQNADDAKATIVRFVVSKKQHGTSSLLGHKLSDWQGPSLYCYNDSTFSPQDFQSLSSIGQATKLDKLATTGRFGLGFNSVFHWTDVPSFVSGDYLVMFDPHAKYVPGATDTSRGIKIRFTNSELVEQFPDQMLPYCLFGNDMKKRFSGTLFRFPFRNASTVGDSEISKTQCGKDDAIDKLFESFKKSIHKVLLFLRHISRVEVYLEDVNDDVPQLIYYADVSNRKPILDKEQDNSGLSMTNINNFRSFASNNILGVSPVYDAKDWNAISKFISGSESQQLSKEAFYSKLLRTPDSQLPRTKHIVTVNFVDYKGPMHSVVDGQKTNQDTKEELCAVKNQPMVITDEYIICSALGTGKCRAMACNPKHRDMKFLPWASVAAHLTRNGTAATFSRGNAFCFLPLPTETGFAVHINGYFELSANRRDIWFGGDMTGAGQMRSEWNRLLLRDVIAPLYCELLLSARDIVGPGKQYDQLWPVEVSSDVWKIVRSGLYHVAEDMPLLYSLLNGGTWVKPKSAVLIDAVETGYPGQTNTTNINGAIFSKKKLMDILLTENLSVASIPLNMIESMRNEGCDITDVNPSMVREWYKESFEHNSLQNRNNAIFLLAYCMEDLIESQNYNRLYGLPLLPLCNGGLGTISRPNEKDVFYIATRTEKQLLEKTSFSLVDVWTEDEKLNGYLKNTRLHEQTNLRELDTRSFVQLLSLCYPHEWSELLEVRWIPIQNSTKAAPENLQWLSMLWEYLASDEDDTERDINLFLNNMQIVPALVGEGERTLMTLTDDMAIVNMTNLRTGSEINTEVANVMRSIGIRTLDVSVFKEKDRPAILRKLKGFVHPFLKALSNSFPEDIEDSELSQRLSSRFKHISNKGREKLRSFLRDPRYFDNDNNFDDDDIHMLRALPIYEVFSKGNTTIYDNLLEEKFLPPSCATPAHLDENFIKATTRRDADLLERLGVGTMSPSLYYERHVSSRIVRGELDRSMRDEAVLKLLEDLPRFTEGEEGQESMRRLSETKFIPNRNGELVKASELYDPQEQGLASLVDDSMLPSLGLCQINLLQSLRELGMKTQLSSEGVLESARRIELQAKQLSDQEYLDEAECVTVRNRARSLLNFLDKESTIKQLFQDEESKTRGFEIGDSLLNESRSGVVEDNVTFENSFTKELNEICWLPVEVFRENDIDGPPKSKRQKSRVGISSPILTRPKADEWICSASTDILSTIVRSNTLINSFGWSEPPSIVVVAYQLTALAELSEIRCDSYSYKQTLATVVPRIYEILDGKLNAADSQEQEKVLMLFHDKPWIWVGDRFVTTSQVAFDAPDHAKPYLYNVPSEMLCFDVLLKSCGVRESFNGHDFVRLLSSLAGQLDGAKCNSKQLDLAIFVARHLSRISKKEFSLLKKSEIFLPSREKVMYRAIDMTYDDAPWLSAMVTGKTSFRHVFVHDDIGNETASILGSKSLRDVLSAKRNGMVKIPCPKSDSLSQLLAKRKMDKKELCKVVMELLEIAEMKGAKQVSIILDRRSHGSMSLLHPCLAAAQGPGLLVCFHDVVLEVDEIVKMSSPAKYYSATVSGNGGCGGNGFPRFGRGLCGCFGLTDCLMALSGRSLMIFDPNGEYFIEDNFRSDQSIESSEALVGDKNEGNQKHIDLTKLNESTAEDKPIRRGKPNARNYSLSFEFCNQFPDQFEPFFSLPLGIEESMKNGMETNGAYYRGTVLRLPLRSIDSPPSAICNKVFKNADKDLDIFAADLEKSLPKSFLFTYNLQSISLGEWLPSQNNCQMLLDCRVSSSPLARRNHLETLTSNKKWMNEKSTLKKLFNTSWVAEKSSYTLQINHRHKDQEDIIDTYVIHSVLAPSRLREMACTEALSPLKLTPALTMAAHIHRRQGDLVLDTCQYSPPQGTIFVGLDTGIKTGLPFLINAPLFLHEWSGSILLNKDDDAIFKSLFPGTRNVVISDKSGGSKMRSLALHVWNLQALKSATKELIPSILKDIRDPIQHKCSKNPRLFYRYWPYHSRIRSPFKDIIDETLYKSLATPDIEIYLTEKNGFHSIGDGCFASPDYPVGQASEFLLQRMSMFTVPRLVVEDLDRFGVGMRQLTPSVARKMLRKDRHSQFLSRRPRDALDILEYCLADIINENFSDPMSKAAVICRTELVGLCLMPLSDGTVGTFGRQMIIATAEQQNMLPFLKSKFVSSFAVERLKLFLCKPGFLNACGLTKFGPKTLASNISTILPSSWEGKDFVQWSNDDTEIDGNDKMPNKLWIFQFWREVPIWDHDAVQLFRRWPLIPTTTGELASCGNSRFIICLCPNIGNSNLRNLLLQKYEDLRNQFETDERREIVGYAAEQRINNERNHVPSHFDEDFWGMGKMSDDISIDEENTASEDGLNNDAGDSIDAIELVEEDDENEIATSQAQELSDEESSTTELPAETPERQQSDALGYDPSSASFQSIHRLLLAIRCPLIESSYYPEDELRKLLPPDRISVSRIIMSTLNQCINYWSLYGNSPDQHRLCWSELSSDDFDELLLQLSKHQDNRLSFMASDLALLKNLPIFETFSGRHACLDGDTHFTIDSSVDTDSVGAYLPSSLQSKLLLDKPQFSDLYQDLSVQSLNEGTILEKFVLKEFINMPFSQKEIVIKNILSKWETLRDSDGLIECLKDVPFVKRKQDETGGEIVFVKADQLYDPRNNFLSLMFDKDPSCFPVEEFASEESLNMLSSVGLKNTVDKDIFLKCAWMVEAEQSLTKSIKLFEYYSEHFGEFYDNNQEFCEQLSEVQCVPAELDGDSLALYRFHDIGVPKDRHLVFKVLPVMPDNLTPPQVLFSSLGINSPPSIGTVLRQVRALTEDEGSLDHWTYKHGSVEDVFSCLFLFLQENYSELSPRVQSGLCDRPIVPVGTTLVKANRLFIRLAKDLAPFFYEVPRAFGAYDVLLRELGVRDSPKSEDYALSLAELNRDIGSGKMNANELKSVVEVVNLIAESDNSTTGVTMYAPDSSGKLICIDDILLNDCPWLVHGQRLDLSQLHFAHPKLSSDLCRKLRISKLSERVYESLEDGFIPREIQDSRDHIKTIEDMLNSDIFVQILCNLLPKSYTQKALDLKKYQLLQVEFLRTRFIMVDRDGKNGIDITNQYNDEGSYCFISQGKIYVSQLSDGLSCELVVATAICDTFKIDRKHVAGLTVMLSSKPSTVSVIKKRMGLFGDDHSEELLRGEPGHPLVQRDLELVEIKPFKFFNKGEIIGVKEGDDDSKLVYGIVVESTKGSTLSRHRVRIRNGKEVVLLSSQIYSLRGGSRVEHKVDGQENRADTTKLNSQGILQSGIISHETDLEMKLLSEENEEEILSGSSFLEPVSRNDVLSAVQDLLQSANLSLNDDARNMIDSNLSLRDEVSQKEAYIENLKNEGKDLSEKLLKGIDAFLCPITREIMEDPVICSDGHTYEKHAIETWLRSNSRSPKTNQQLSSRTLIPNHALRSTIEGMTQSMNAMKNFTSSFN